MNGSLHSHPPEADRPALSVKYYHESLGRQCCGGEATSQTFKNLSLNSVFSAPLLDPGGLISSSEFQSPCQFRVKAVGCGPALCGSESQTS